MSTDSQVEYVKNTNCVCCQLILVLQSRACDELEKQVEELHTQTQSLSEERDQGL